MIMLVQPESVRTTVTLPVTLMQRSQQFVDKGIVPNRNALVVAALERFLAELERAEIDRQFAVMADDDEYQAFSTQMTEAFADSDWEAFRMAEKSV